MGMWDEWVGLDTAIRLPYWAGARGTFAAKGLITVISCDVVEELGSFFFSFENFDFFILINFFIFLNYFNILKSNKKYFKK
jgi:hypothetical protein